MSQVYKNFKNGEKKITTALTHKLWNVDVNNSASLGVFIGVTKHAAKYDYNLEDDSFGDATIEGLTKWDGNKPSVENEFGVDLNKHNQYLLGKSIDHLYYEGADTTHDVFCNDTPTETLRNMGNQYSVITIPSGIYGEKIKPGTFTFSSSAITLTDDGFGNLIDSLDTSGSAARAYTENTTHFHLHFNEVKNLLNSLNNKIKGYPSLSADYNIQQKSGQYTYNLQNVSHPLFSVAAASIYGQALNFHGSQSLEYSHSIELPHNNSVVEIKGTKGLQLADEFSLSLFINCPESQSISESYSGGFVGDNNLITRELRSRSRNVIITGQQWSGQSHPLELSIFNDSHADNGKLHFTQKTITEGNQSVSLTSNIQVNDGNWHHVLITAPLPAANGLSTVYMYIDGTLTAQNSRTLAVTRNNKSNTNIFIGARPYGYKRKYKNAKTGKFSTIKENRNFIDPFSGSVKEVRLFDKFMGESDGASGPSTADIANLSASAGDNRVGNIMYDHGIATIPFNLFGSKGYQTYQVGTDHNISFRATHRIKEHLYICNILDGEFNATYNPTARENFDARNDNLQAYTTHSEFNPYITSIGLYDDYGNLCAVGKLAQPIKNQDDYDNSFQVRFDTTI